MIIADKMVEVIRNALVDYESATGLECQIRYADRLSAVVEVVLELAEDTNVVQVYIKPTVMDAPPAPVVGEVADEPANLDEPVEQMAEEAEPTKSPKDDTLHKQVIRLKKEGKTAKQIADKLNIGVSTVYWHFKFERDMANK